MLTLDSTSQPVEVPNIYIHDMRIVGTLTADASGGRSAIRFNTQQYHKLGAFRLERVFISQMSDVGLDLEGYNGPGDNAIVTVALSDVEISNCGGAGCVLQDAYVVTVRTSRFASNAYEGLRISGAVLGGVAHFISCRFESNRAISPSSKSAWSIASISSVSSWLSAVIHARPFLTARLNTRAVASHVEPMPTEDRLAPRVNDTAASIAPS